VIFESTQPGLTKSLWTLEVELGLVASELNDASFNPLISTHTSMNIARHQVGVTVHSKQGVYFCPTVIQRIAADIFAYVVERAQVVVSSVSYPDNKGNEV